MSDTFYNPLDLAELSATPANPASGFRRIYSKTDGKLYQKTSGGIETALENVRYTVTTVTTTTFTATATSGDNVILVDTTTAAGNVTITIPTAVGNTALYIIKKIDTSAFTVTITPTTSTIDGGASAVLKIKDASIDIVSNNANWFII